jgi:anti-sigma regulatory factor (Ser/Thr protein kinase)
MDFPRDFDALPGVFHFLDGFADQTGMGAADRFAINMAVEELFTNFVKYNPTGTADIEIEILRDGGAVEVILTDADSEPFDVTVDRQVDTSASLDQRSVGGLGLHLIQRMMDQVYYDYKDRRTCIRLVKHLTE